MNARARSVVAATAAFAAGATILVTFLPSLRFAYHAPSLRIALETSAALIALVAAYLIFGRYRRTASFDHLLLVLALGLLSLANVIVVVLVAADPGWLSGRIVAVTSAFGAVALAVAAFAPHRILRRPRRAALLAGLGVGLLFALSALLAVTLVAAPSGASAGVLDPQRPALPSDLGFAVPQAIACAAFALAAIGFARAGARTGDEFLRWVAIGAVLAAFGRVHYLLFQPIHPDWIHTGHIFRLLFYTVLLLGAAREIRGYWQGLAERAVFDERRRIARDLHDGVAQELAFIARNAPRLAGDGDERAAGRIAAAAQRGLTDSRRAIAALTRPLDEPLDEVLAQAVGEVAERCGADVSVRVDPGIDVSHAAREALVRIACEAVVNAARHSKADRVRLEVTNGQGVLLRIEDDGVGFDPADVVPSELSGFGLVSMRERAQAVGGRLKVRSRPGAGTAVEVELP